MLNNLSLFFSSSCNFNCVYCSIHKHRACMDENNKELREKIQSGEYANNVISKFSHLQNDMNEISLWGMEPTINADVFDKLIIPLLDFFVNVDKISFSTNGWLGYNRLRYFIDCLNKYSMDKGRQISLSLQLSIDGPPWITDSSRKNGAADNIVQVARDIITNTPADINIKIKMHTKPTLDMEFIRKMLSDESLLIQWYRYFDDIHEELTQLNTNANISVQFNNTPTFVDPGFHTVEDGKDIARFVNVLRRIDDSQFKHYKHPLVWQLLVGVHQLLHTDNYGTYIHNGCCSSGRYTANVDMNGDLFGCHALFSYSFLNTEHILTNGYLAHGDKEAHRWQSNCQLWHEYPGSKEKFANIIISSLAAYGQIDKVYLTDSNMRSLLFHSVGGMYCPFAGAEITSGTFIPPTSYYRFFGNGLLQEAMNYLKECELI